jgi:hypothetical protein
LFKNKHWRCQPVRSTMELSCDDHAILVNDRFWKGQALKREVTWSEDGA